MAENLAVFGGEAITRDSFPPWPALSEKSLSDALDTLRSGRLVFGAGPRGREFETRWAEWTGARHAVSCSSGTAALHLALLALGVGPGDEVIVPSHSFIASSSAVALAGATPVFCDVGEDQTIDWRGVAPLVSGRTRAVIAVHLYGAVCDMGPLLAEAQGRGLAVIEDCAQCVGGEYKGRKAGTAGRAGCFSFSQTKHITTAGEGGRVVTDDDELARALARLRDHGRDPEAPLEVSPVSPPPSHLRLGFNYRLSEVAAAVGLGELARLDSWNLPRRLGYAKAYDHAFRELPGVRMLPFTSESRRNAYWQYPLQLALDRLTCPAGQIREALLAEGIPCSAVQWRESYDEPLFQGREVRRCQTAEKLAERTVVLYLHPSWDRSHIELCIAGVKKVLRAFKR
jgi:dTDP-4-amino-4,6-dideoxygalactose transaminase